MVHDGTHLRQLKLIQEKNLSQQEADIVDAFNYAVQASTQTQQTRWRGK